MRLIERTAFVMFLTIAILAANLYRIQRNNAERDYKALQRYVDEVKSCASSGVNFDASGYWLLLNQVGGEYYEVPMQSGAWTGMCAEYGINAKCGKAK